MPRVHHVKKARKANKAHGIKKGQEYWWWGVMSGGRGFKRYSLTAPKPSQLTGSDFWRAVLSLQEDHEACPEYDLLEEEIQQIKDELENIKSETEDKLSNMPDSLQEGPTGQMLQERVDALDSCISDLDSVDTSGFDESEVEIPKGTKKEDKEALIEEAKQVKAEELWQEVQDALGNISCE